MRNYLKSIAFVIAAGSLFLISGTAFAHHGAAVFDTSKLLTLTGTVLECRFVNPHVIIVISAKDPSTGNVEKWSGETFSAARLAQFGWSKSILKPGDRITLVGSPMKSGYPTMAIRKVIKDGQELEMP